MIGIQEEEDPSGETEKDHLIRRLKQQENVVLMKSREENFKEKGIMSCMKCR